MKHKCYAFSLIKMFPMKSNSQIVFCGEKMANKIMATFYKSLLLVSRGMNQTHCGRWINKYFKLCSRFQVYMHSCNSLCALLLRSHLVSARETMAPFGYIYIID